MGGSTVLPVLLYRLCAWVVVKLFKRNVRAAQPAQRVAKFVAAFLSAWFSFRLLNQTRPLPRLDIKAEQISTSPDGPNHETANRHQVQRPELAGRTMDLTLFTVTRAMDVVACIGWDHWYRRRKAQNRWTAFKRLAPSFADAGVFAMSSAIIMWAWFYAPERLPRTYEKWIGEVAKVDSRLIEALRRVRRNDFVYGKDTGQAPLLESMCKDYNWPEQWGDPSKTIPIPCEMVHMGCGPNCEKHAVSRFARTFKFACATYIPLQVVLRLRGMKSTAALGRAISDAAQSSAFLASFVALFYYSVCLARTRLGPKIFDQKTVTPQMWDAGLCVGSGCFRCGWSVLVEKARKRQELALFVAPRAVATVLPRLYEKKVCPVPSLALPGSRWLHPPGSAYSPFVHLMWSLLSFHLNCHGVLTIFFLSVSIPRAIRLFYQCCYSFHLHSGKPQHGARSFWPYRTKCPQLDFSRVVLAVEAFSNLYYYPSERFCL